VPVVLVPGLICSDCLVCYDMLSAYVIDDNIYQSFKMNKINA